MGHLDQERKNLQSTKTQTEISNRKNLQTNETYLQCINVEEYNNLPQIKKIYSNQTGSFPYWSSRGNQYLFVMYDYDSNAIVFNALKNRNSVELK